MRVSILVIRLVHILSRIKYFYLAHPGANIEHSLLAAEKGVRIRPAISHSQRENECE